MKIDVEHNQSLKTQPGFIANRDGPEQKPSRPCQANIEQ